MVAVARTFALLGIDAEPVHVELHVAGGLPSFTVVGLPDAGVRESRERVRAALVNSGFDFPQRRITANLAPADLPKAGPGFDLAIAGALLAATKQLAGPLLDRYVLAGELALDGSIRPVPGALAMAERARAWGMRGIVVAPADAPQAAMVEGIEVMAVARLSGLKALAEGGIDPEPAPQPPSEASANGLPDLADLRAQSGLRRALEIAAAGGHSLLLVGPPGVGKTLAARRLPSLLPPLSRSEALEVTRIAGACAERVDQPLAAARPFRAPHHTISGPALIGGGTPPRPGEVTRAHRGVLFLDELAEFRRDALEALRQPLEEGRVTIARARRAISLPCRFTLVAASNPCPCGRGEDSGDCECHASAVARYQAKLSGALADRIDIVCYLQRPSAEGLDAGPGEGSAAVRERVLRARARQAERLGEGRCNSDLTPGELARHCRLDADASALLRQGHQSLGLSGRGWDRVIRVARTIADLEGELGIGGGQVAEGLTLRRRSGEGPGA